MFRRGVVLVTMDSGAAAFLQDLLEEHAPEQGRALELGRARTCIAATTGLRRLRLIVIDGEPPDLSAGALIEAIRITDQGVPIVLVRYRWGGRSPTATSHDGIHVVPGPFVCAPMERLLASLVRPRHPTAKA